MKGISGRRDWPGTWLSWALGTTVGWVLQWLVSGGLAMSTFWDPDEVEAYLRSPSRYLLVRVLYGAMWGIAIAAVFTLIRWIAKRPVTRRSVLSFVATVLGTSVLCGLSAIGPGQVESDLMIALRSGAVGGAVGGLIAGSCQSAILSRVAGKLGGWIAATVGGWTLSGAAVWAAIVEAPFGDHGFRQPLGLAVVCCAGTLAGLGQWLALRRSVRRAGWWVAAVALTWVATYVLPDPLWSVKLLAPGVITATMLVVLLADSGPTRSLEPVAGHGE